MSHRTPQISAVERTRALLAPPAAGIRRPDGDAARVRLAAAISAQGVRSPAGQQVVLTVAMLRQALVDPGRLAFPQEPFRWKPVFARRSLGLAVVEACAAGRFHAPAHAAEPIARQAVAEWERTGWRTYHWEPWLAGLAPGARAVVLADAIGWATGVWSAFDWRSVTPDAEIGASQDQWVCPAAPSVRLRARPDLRVRLVGSAVAGADEPSAERPVALVSVCGGAPAPGWVDELAYLALVSAVRSTIRPVPVRVMGLWPDAGIHRLVEIDDLSFDRVIDRVAAAVSAVVAARCSTLAAS